MEGKQKNSKKGVAGVKRVVSEAVNEVLERFRPDNQDEKAHQQLVDDVCYNSKLFDEEKRANDRALEEALHQSRLDEQKRQEELKNKIINAKFELQEDFKHFIRENKCDDSSIAFTMIAAKLDRFEKNTETAIFDSPRNRLRQDSTLQEHSMLIIETIKVLESSHEISLREILTYFEDHIFAIEEQCTQIKSIYKFDSELHKGDVMSEFRHHIIDDKFICIDIKGDGNCLWNSISVSLFGNTSYMSPLRLLTAYALTNYEDIFKNYIKEQKTKFGYKHELTFEELVRASIELNIWGDELHVLALSLILRRPIYSYGSFVFLVDNYIRDYTDLKIAYESDVFPNHFKHLANTDDENNEPILLYYNGESHYSVVLPYGDEFKPLVPKCEILRPLIDNRKSSDINRKSQSVSKEESTVPNKPQHSKEETERPLIDNRKSSDINRTSQSVSKEESTFPNKLQHSKKETVGVLVDISDDDGIVATNIQKKSKQKDIQLNKNKEQCNSCSDKLTELRKCKDEIEELNIRIDVFKKLNEEKTLEKVTLQVQLKDLENEFNALQRSCNLMEAQRDFYKERYEKVLVSAGQRGFNSAQNGSDSTRENRQYAAVATGNSTKHVSNHKTSDSMEYE